MNREQIVNFLNTKQLDPQLASEMITDYLESLGKSSDEISKILQLTSVQPRLLTFAISQMTGYFRNKYSINKISKDNQIICYY